jgi:hypothetical protein
MKITALLVVGLGCIVGLASGWVCQQLFKRPVLQSALAMLLSWMVASTIGAIALAIVSIRRGGIAAVSMGVLEVLITSIPVVLVGLLLHVLLGSIAAHTGPWLALNRSIIAGAVGGVCGAVASTFTAMRA